MPLRDYKCLDCNLEIRDVLEKTPEDKPEMCERCHSANLERLVTAPGGYTMHGSNSASTTPRGAGSKRRK